MKDHKKQRYLLTKHAISDLAEFWNYTFDARSETQADKYYVELLEICQILTEEPEKGKSYELLILKLKAAKINSHIIFYRTITENTIEIERILHEQMDLKARLRK